MRTKCVAFFMAVVCLGAGQALPAPPGLDPAVVFARRCSSCHTVGQGDRVGPDLEGVTQRRQRRWLVGFIRSSESVIRSGDPTAAQLFQKYRRQRMPDHDLPVDVIHALLDYVAAGGPDAGRSRAADAATPSEVEAGRRLFSGEQRLASGGAACVACHAVGDTWAARGGTFAPNLTNVYPRYRDKALASFLQRPCFPRAPEAAKAVALTSDESFALRAYLREAAVRSDSPARAGADATSR